MGNNGMFSKRMITRPYIIHNKSENPKSAVYFFAFKFTNFNIDVILFIFSYTLHLCGVASINTFLRQPLCTVTKYSRSSRKRTPRKFDKVVVTRTDRLRE